MKKLILGENDISTLYPELLDEWDYEINERLPSEYTRGSNAYVYWVCKKCGYHYKAKIANRTLLKRGCPCCANKIVVPGINDLATTHPELVSEWDYNKNQELTPEKITYGSGKKVWWICKKGHSYQATVLHRTNGKTNCPICNVGRQTSFAEQAVFYYVKKVCDDAINHYKDIFENGMELDIFIPSLKLGIEYDGEAWHKKDKIDREIRKYQICKSKGIKLLRLKEKMSEEYRNTADFFISADRMYEHGNLERIIRFIIDYIDTESNFWTRKDMFHLHSYVDVDINRDESEIRSFMTELREGSLKDLFPEIASEWHLTKNGAVTPNMVKPQSDIKVYWICPNCGYVYRTTVGHRTNGTNCPKCAIRRNAKAKSKAVLMLDSETKEVIKTFPSISEAARESGISSSNISMVCQGKRKNAGGYAWTYLFDENKS